MATDEPPYLTIGTDVSAKYKGAFCEAKIKKVIRSVKCKITFKNNLGSFMITDEQIKGPLRSGAEIEALHPEKKQYFDAIINKMQDYSQYTVVFDDGDETTLRRTSLCLKSGRHFAESPTLDQFPLTNPEHFGSPVLGRSKAKRKRRSTMNSATLDYYSSDEDLIPRKSRLSRGKEKDTEIGKVLCVDYGDRRKKDNWYPGLISNTGQMAHRINPKEEYLIRSFKDGKYYQVPKKDTREFNRDVSRKIENNSLRQAVEKAILYLDKGVLPTQWAKSLYTGMEAASNEEDSHDSDSDSSDDEPSEEKDRFVAQLYKFMDERGTPINKAPTVGSRDLNLYKLFKIVHKMHGYNRVTNQNKWKIVYSKMGFPISNQSGSNQIKLAYKRYLHSFEDFYRKLGCTMNSRSTRGMHRSDRNFITTRNKSRDVSSPKGKKEEKEQSIERKPDKKNIPNIEKKVSSPKAEDKPTKSPEKKKVEKVKVEDKVRKEEKEKPRLSRSGKETEEKKETRNERARTREDAKREKTESPEKKKETRSSTKSDPEKEEKKVDIAVKKDEKIIKCPKEEKTVKKEEPFIKKYEKFPKDKSRLLEQVPPMKEKREIKREKSIDKKNEPIKTEKIEEKKDRKVIKKEEKPEPKAVIKDDGFVRVLCEESEKDTSISGTEEDDFPPGKLKRSPNDKDDISEDSDEDKDKDKIIEIGDRVKVKYGRGRMQKVYEAKVLKVEIENGEKKYYVHYAGWNTRYDEWVRRNFIVENISENNRAIRKKKQDAKSTSPSPPKKSERGQLPGSSLVSKLHRKNSTSSTNSSTVSNFRTRRSDKSNQHGSQLSEGLQLRKRAAKKSFTSAFTDTSQDSESDADSMLMDDDDDDDMDLDSSGALKEEDMSEEEESIKKKVVDKDVKDLVKTEKFESSTELPEVRKTTVTKFHYLDGKKLRVELENCAVRLGKPKSFNTKQKLSLEKDQTQKPLEKSDKKIVEKKVDSSEDKEINKKDSSKDKLSKELEKEEKYFTKDKDSSKEKILPKKVEVSKEKDLSVQTTEKKIVSDKKFFIEKELAIKKEPLELKEVEKHFTSEKKISEKRDIFESKDVSDKKISEKVEFEKKEFIKKEQVLEKKEEKSILLEKVPLKRESFFEKKNLVEPKPDVLPVLKKVDQVVEKRQSISELIEKRYVELIEKQPQTSTITTLMQPKLADKSKSTLDNNMPQLMNYMTNYKDNLGSLNTSEKPNLPSASTFVPSSSDTPLSSDKAQKSALPLVQNKPDSTIKKRSYFPMFQFNTDSSKYPLPLNIPVGSLPKSSMLPLKNTEVCSPKTAEKVNVSEKIPCKECLTDEVPSAKNVVDNTEVKPSKIPLDNKINLDSITISKPNDSKKPNIKAKDTWKSVLAEEKRHIPLSMSTLNKPLLGVPPKILPSAVSIVSSSNNEKTSKFLSKTIEDKKTEIVPKASVPIAKPVVKNKDESIYKDPLPESIVSLKPVDTKESSSHTSVITFASSSASTSLFPSEANKSKETKSNLKEIIPPVKEIKKETKEEPNVKIDEKLFDQIVDTNIKIKDELESNKKDLDFGESINKSLTELSIDEKAKENIVNPDHSIINNSGNVFLNVSAEKSLKDSKELFSLHKPSNEIIKEEKFSSSSKSSSPTESGQDASSEPVEKSSTSLEGDSNESRKEVKKKKSKASKNIIDKDDKSKDGKVKCKKKTKLDPDDSIRSKDSDMKSKTKKFKKNKNKKRLSKCEDRTGDSLSKLDSNEGTSKSSFLEKIKKKEKRKRDDKKFLKSEPKDESGDLFRKDKKKGKKNKEKLSGDRKMDILEKKLKKKKKTHIEENLDSDSEKEIQSRISEKKKKKDKKKLKPKDTSSSDDAAENRLLIDEDHSGLTPIQDSEKTGKGDDPDMSFLLCEEKVPASPVEVNSLPEDTTGSSSIDDNSNNRSPSSEDDRIQPVNLDSYSRTAPNLEILDTVNKRNAEACAVLDNTPPTTPSSSPASMPSSSPSHDREPFMHYTESTQSGRESCERDIDSFHCGLNRTEITESEEYRAATTLAFAVCKSVEENSKLENYRTPLKRQKSDLDDYSPSKRRKKTKRSLGTTDVTKIGNTRYKAASRSPRGESCDAYDSSNASILTSGSPPHHSSNPNLFASFAHHPSHVSTPMGDSALGTKSSKATFYIPLHEYKDPEKRINILQDKMSELKKLYASLKAEVAMIDRRRKKARKKIREAAQVTPANNSTTSAGDNSENCS